MPNILINALRLYTPSYHTSYRLLKNILYFGNIMMKEMYKVGKPTQMIV